MNVGIESRTAAYFANLCQYFVKIFPGWTILCVLVLKPLSSFCWGDFERQTVGIWRTHTTLKLWHWHHDHHNHNDDHHNHNADYHNHHDHHDHHNHHDHLDHLWPTGCSSSVNWRCCRCRRPSDPTTTDNDYDDGDLDCEGDDDDNGDDDFD